MCTIRCLAMVSGLTLLSSSVLAQQAQTRPAAGGMTATRPAAERIRPGAAATERPQPSPLGADMRRAARREGQQLIMGQIIDTREVRIEDERHTHVLAKIRTPRGPMQVVDLGSREALDLAGEVSAGDRIAVSGVMIQLNDRPVLVAEQMARMVKVPREGDVLASALEQGGRSGRWEGGR